MGRNDARGNGRGPRNDRGHPGTTTLLSRSERELEARPRLRPQRDVRDVLATEQCRALVDVESVLHDRKSGGCSDNLCKARRVSASLLRVRPGGVPATHGLRIARLLNALGSAARTCDVK